MANQRYIVPRVPANPASPADSEVWYNTTDAKLRARIAGATVDLGGSSAWADITGKPTTAAGYGITDKAHPFMTPPSGTYIHTAPAGFTGSFGAPAGTADQLNLYPHVFGASFTADTVLITVSAAAAGGLAKVAVYDADTNGRPSALLFETNTIDCSASGDRSVALASNYTFEAGKTYWIGIRVSSGSVTVLGCARPNIQGSSGSVPTQNTRNILRRTIAFATAAPSSWAFSNPEGAGQSQTSIVSFRVV